MASRPNDLRLELFEHMKKNPREYSAEKMKMLYGITPAFPEMREIFISNTDIFSRFLAEYLTVSHRELVDSGVIPESISCQAVIEAPATAVPASVSQSGRLPEGRTDVMFIGHHGSGKNSLLTCLLKQLQDDGRGHFPSNDCGVAPDESFLENLQIPFRANKWPRATMFLSNTVLPYDIEDQKGNHHLNLINVETTRPAATDGERKTVFFTVDYSALLGQNPALSAEKQLEFLMSALESLCNDGPDRSEPQKGCTMSGVDTVAVLFTKCDLMKADDPDARAAEARKAMEGPLKPFATRLSAALQQFGCNRSNSYAPYVVTYSVGDFYIGETFIYNPAPTRELIDFITTVIPSRKKSRRFFGLF